MARSRTRLSRQRLPAEAASRLLARTLAALLVVGGFAIVGCGGDEDDHSDVASPATEDPGAVHVHGLGTNPSDGALFIATHTGLFRVPVGEDEASRVADRYQDTMGFTVVGPDRFLGSGHPDARDDLPPFLGLIESGDAGESWQPVSLLGEADFHALEARGERVYGFGSDWETRKPQLLVSSDGGESWEERPFPEPFISLAMNPTNPDRIVASGESAAYVSSDTGHTWRELNPGAGLVAWRSPNELVMIDAQGTVLRGTGKAWREVGQVGGQPAAFEAEPRGLYVALHDGTIKRSTDGARTWSVHFQP